MTRTKAATLLAVASVGILSMAGCGPKTDPTGSAPPSVPATASPTPSGSPAVGSPPPTGSTDRPDPDPTGSTAPPKSGPRIVYFQIKQKPACPAGTTQAPIDGRPLVLEWKAVGVDKITISVDGPGIYGTFEPEGSQEFGFGCGGAPGTVVEHTYRLKTIGGGVERSATVIARATVNEIIVVP